MVKFAAAYLGSAVVFLVLDFIWLSNASRLLYRPKLGNLLSENPNLGVAALFYLFYVAGVVILVVLPAESARSWLMAVGLGAVLGFVAYGTYDFTNLATIRDWPAIVSIIDLIWGTFVTAVTALAGYIVVRLVTGSG